MSDNELGSADGPGQGSGPPQVHPFHIKIDREIFTVLQRARTGAQLRALVSPPIGIERDLFQVVPGGSDLKIELGQTVIMSEGLRFFTAPAQINPGAR